MHHCMEMKRKETGYMLLHGEEICITVWRGDMHDCMERRYASLYGEEICMTVWRGYMHHCMERYA